MEYTQTQRRAKNMIKKINLSSIFAQLILLFFVIIWIMPTFGLFISSLRDKDLLAISGWWTSLTTTQVNEIYRMSGNESQIKEENYFIQWEERLQYLQGYLEAILIQIQD